MTECKSCRTTFLLGKITKKQKRSLQLPDCLSIDKKFILKRACNAREQYALHLKTLSNTNVPVVSTTSQLYRRAPYCYKERKSTLQISNICPISHTRCIYRIGFFSQKFSLMDALCSNGHEKCEIFFNKNKKIFFLIFYT